MFRRFAAARGWAYLGDGDGLVESMAHDFEGFGRFRSSSAGKLVPEAVVLGDVEEGRICCFLHGTTGYEGKGRLWTVCMIQAGRPLGGPLRIRPRSVRWLREVGGDPRVRFHDDPTFEAGFEVAAPNPDAARACLDSRVRGFLSSEHPGLPFPVAIQIRGRRVAAYLARKNARAERVADLQALVRFTRGLAATLSTAASRSA
ncbi:MAG: hypothetical protein ACODAE_01875, partial [Gemmatimonadota bacterium]